MVLTNVMRGVHALGSLWTVRVLFWATVAVLVVTRRFRHLFVFVGAVVGVIALSSLLAYLFMRPRPLEVEILGDWTGAAHPARPVAVFAATVVGMLYSLVPQGRLRQLGKPVIAVLVTALSISLVYLGVNSPTDVLIGAIIGVTIPLVAFRLLAPNEVFPVTYRRGSSAHLDVGGRRRPGHPPGPGGPAGHPGAGGQAVRAVGVGRIHPLRVCAKGDPNTYLFAKLYAAATSAPTAGTSWAGPCCMAGWRTRSRSTPCAGWSSRRTTPCGSSMGPGCAARSRSGSWRSPPSAEST